MAVEENSLLTKDEMPEGELHSRANSMPRQRLPCAFHPTTMSANHNPIQDTAISNAVPYDTHNDLHKKSTRPIPMIVYTRSQLLSLHISPLVKPPSNMPELKDWFGCVCMLPINMTFVFIS